MKVYKKLMNALAAVEKIVPAGLAPNVWVLIGARFLMGIGVGIDLLEIDKVFRIS